MAARPMPIATVETAIATAVKLGPDIPKLCLGSNSSSRRAILAAALGLTGPADVEHKAPEIDEYVIGDRAGGDAVLLTRRIAVAKADALLADKEFTSDLRSRNVLLVTGDQVVTDGGASGTIREKPKDAAEARSFVSSYAAGAPCATVGALCVHDIVNGVRAVATHVATVNFEKDWPTEDIDAIVDDPDVGYCAGALMVEHPKVAPHILSIDGGTDSIMGLSTLTLKSLISEVQKLSASGPDMLQRPELRNWAVVGDVLNQSKPAFRIVQQLESTGRKVVRVNPRDQSGTCFTSLVAAASEMKISAVNLVIAPPIGKKILVEMARLGINDIFIQPGADEASVVEEARALGIRVQQGCLLVSPPVKL